MKREITFHADGYSCKGHAAVNVKIYGSGLENQIKMFQAAKDAGGDRRFMPTFQEWYEDLDQDWKDAAWEDACRQGWDRADDLAKATFGPDYGVTSEGRSGGWLVVTYKNGLAFSEDEIRETWKARDFKRWEKFRTRVRELADDVVYLYGADLYADYEAKADNRQKAYDMAGDNPFGV